MPDIECITGDFTNKSLTQTIAVLTQGTGYTTQILSIFTAIISGASTTGTIIVFNYFGILGLYQFLNVNYPSNVLVYFQSYFAMNNAPDFPNYFLKSTTLSAKYLYSDTTINGDNKFYLFRISYLFLKNFGGKISLLAILIAAVPVLTVIGALMRNVQVNKKLQTAFDSFKAIIQWNLILTVLLSVHVPMILTGCIQYRYLDHPISMFDISSIAICLLASIGFVILTIVSYFYTKIQNLNSVPYPNLTNSTKILANQEYASAEIDSNTNATNQKKKNKYWLLASCLRNLFLVPFITTLSNYPLVQCSAAIATNTLFFLGVLKWQFFDRRIKSVVVKTCEGINAAIPSLFLVYGICDLLKINISQTQRNDIGWAIIALVSTVVILSLVYQLLETWFVLKKLMSPVWAQLKKLLGFSIGDDIWKRKKIDLKGKKVGSKTTRPPPIEQNETPKDSSSNFFDEPKEIELRPTRPIIPKNIPTLSVNTPTMSDIKLAVRESRLLIRENKPMIKDYMLALRESNVLMTLKEARNGIPSHQDMIMSQRTGNKDL